MKFDVIHNNKVINTISAVDADHASDVVSTIYADVDYTKMTVRFKEAEPGDGENINIVHEGGGPNVIGKIVL